MNSSWIENRETKHSKMKYTLLIISFALLAGCATQMPPKQTAKDGSVTIVLETDDVLYSQVLVGESGIKGVANRIEKYLKKNLSERGIKTDQGDASKGAKLTVKLDTIEAVTTTSIGFWAPIIRQQPKIKYHAALVAENGTTLFDSDDSLDDESLDTLTKKIADRLGARVSKFFR